MKSIDIKLGPNDPLKTKLGTEILLDTRSILYICKFIRYPKKKIEVVAEGMFKTASAGLDFYSNIPNPESQLVIGKDYDELIKNLIKLHKNMEKESWLNMLANSI